MNLLLAVVTLLAVVAVLDAGGDKCPGSWRYKTGKCNYGTCKAPVKKATCKKKGRCYGKPYCGPKQTYVPCKARDQRKCYKDCDKCYYYYYDKEYEGECYKKNYKCVINKKRVCKCYPYGCHGDCKDEPYHTTDCPHGYHGCKPDCDCYYKYKEHEYYGNCYTNDYGDCVIKKARYCYCTPHGCYGDCKDEAYKTTKCPYKYGHQHYGCKHCECEWKYYTNKYEGGCHMHYNQCMIKLKRYCKCDPNGCGNCDNSKPYHYIPCPSYEPGCY